MHQMKNQTVPAAVSVDSVRLNSCSSSSTLAASFIFLASETDICQITHTHTHTEHVTVCFTAGDLLPLPIRLFSYSSLCVCLCVQNISKTYERILMKFFGWVGRCPGNNRLNFGGDPVPLSSSSCFLSVHILLQFSPP